MMAQARDSSAEAVVEVLGDDAIDGVAGAGILPRPHFPMPPCWPVPDWPRWPIWL